MEFATSKHIYSFSPYKMEIKSKEILLDDEKVIGFSTAVIRVVDHENPRDNIIYKIFVRRRLNSGEFSRTIKEYKIDNLSVEKYRSFFDQFQGTPEHNKVIELRSEAQKEFAEENYRRFGGGGSMSARFLGINAPPSRAAPPSPAPQPSPSHDDVDPENEKRIYQIKSEINKLRAERDEPYNQDRWVEDEMIAKLEDELRTRKKNR